jgi:hypothetical protein
MKIWKSPAGELNLERHPFAGDHSHQDTPSLGPHCTAGVEVLIFSASDYINNLRS